MRAIIQSLSLCSLLLGLVPLHLAQAATVSSLVATNAATVQIGGTVTLTVTDGGATAGDWVGLYVVGQSGANYVSRLYLNGSLTAPTTIIAAASLRFVLPTTINQKYYFALNRANGSAVGVVSATFAPLIPPSSLTVVSPAAALIGRSVSVSVADGLPAASDWVGLYVVGQSGSNFVAKKFLNGATTAPTAGVKAATLSFTLPVTLNQKYYFALNSSSGAVIATSAPVAPNIPPSSLTVSSPTKVVAGASASVSVADGLPSPGDWVGLYLVGQSGSNFVGKKFLNGAATAPASGMAAATLSFTLPSTLSQKYYFALNSADGTTVIATSATFSPLNPPSTLIVKYATTVLAAGPVWVTVADITPSPTDWVGFYLVGQSGNNYISKQYLNGFQTAPAAGVPATTLQFNVPATPNQKFYFTLNSGTSSAVLATSANFTALMPPSTAVVQNPTAVTAGGPVWVNINDGIPAPGDWVGFYAYGQSGNNYIGMQYLNGLTTVPQAGVQATTLKFNVPATPNLKYYFALHSATGTTLLASSAVFTSLKPPSVLLVNNPTTVYAGGPVWVSVADGAPTAADWVGLYVVGKSGLSFLSKQFLNASATIPPTSGIPMTTLQFTLPTTANQQYYFTLNSNNGYTLLATSAKFAALPQPPASILSSAVGVVSSALTAIVSSATSLVAPPPPTASFLGNGLSNSVTFIVGQPYSYAWSATNAVSAASTLNADVAGVCGLPGPSAPVNWTANSLNGTSTGQAAFAPCAIGHTFTYTYTVKNSAGQTAKAVLNVLAVAAPSPQPAASLIGNGQANTVTFIVGQPYNFAWNAANAVSASATVYADVAGICGLPDASSPAPWIANTLGGASSGTAFSACALGHTFTYTYTVKSASGQTVQAVLKVVGGAPPLPSSVGLAQNVGIVPGGSVAVNVFDSSPSATDWVALYAFGQSGSNYISRQYLNGSATAPTAGISNAALKFTLPTTVNQNYYLVLYRSDSYSPITSSASFVAQPGSVLAIANASTLAIGGTVTLNVFDGTATAGDWVGMYSADQSGGSTVIGWQYLNGSQTASSAGISSATLRFVLPPANTSYYFILYQNNGTTYQSLAALLMELPSNGSPGASSVLIQVTQ